jgi:hypothetical protein
MPLNHRLHILTRYGRESRVRRKVQQQHLVTVRIVFHDITAHGSASQVMTRETVLQALRACVLCDNQSDNARRDVISQLLQIHAGILPDAIGGHQHGKLVNGKW